MVGANVFKAYTQNGVINTLSAKKSPKCQTRAQASPPAMVAYTKAAQSTREAFLNSPLASLAETILETARGRL